jgi:hypothetical protein
MRCMALIGWLLVMLVGCSEPSPALLGGTLDLEAFEAQKVPVDTVRSAQDGEELVLEGQVGKVCKAGCWFYLQNDAHMLYVDVLGDFKVPLEATTRRALVKGRVSGDGGARILQATRVALFPADGS